MPIFTQHYGLAAFLDGDIYSAALDAQRWQIVDNQAASFSEFVGDGIISGWDIEPLTFPSFKISKGGGLIDGFYVTTENDVIYDSSDVSPSTTYYFWAKRIKNIVGAFGDPSSLLIGELIDITAPAVPTSFSAWSPAGNIDNFYNDMNILLSWDQNIEIDFDHYNIYRSTDNIDFSFLDSSTTNSYDDDGLTEGTIYYYRLSAVDKSDNESGFVTDFATTPISVILPPNPSSFDVFASDFSINLVWNELSAGSEILDHYQVTYSLLDVDNSVLSSTNIIVDKSLLYLRIDELENERKYEVVLRSVDNRGRISSGIPKLIIPRRDLGPPDPQSITYTEQGNVDGPNSVSILLNWVPGTGEYNEPEVINYKVYFTVHDSKGDNESQPIITAASQNYLTVSAVQYVDGIISIPENSLITVRITSLALSGHESQGNYIRFKTNIYKKTKILRNLTATYDIKTIKLNWTNNEDTYKIKIDIYKKAKDDPYDVPVLVSSEIVDKTWVYIISQPDLGFIYYAYLTPININGTYGETINITQETFDTDEFPLPVKPSDLEISANFKSAQLIWKEPEDTILTKFYRIYRSKSQYSVDYSDYSMIDEIGVGVNRFVDYGLEEGEYYTWYLTSVDIFDRETPHLLDEFSNVGMISRQIPDYISELGPVLSPEINIVNNDAVLEWEIVLGHSFDAFEILRSIGNLHSFYTIATISYETNQFQYSYIDQNAITTSNVNYYYVIRKIANDTSFEKRISYDPPDNSVYLGSITLSDTGFSNIDTDGRRNIYKMQDSLKEKTDVFLLNHLHQGIGARIYNSIDGVLYKTAGFDADRIDLNPSLVSTNWSTNDGLVFFTEDDISDGSLYVVKLNGIFPSVLYTIDSDNGKIVFAEPILTYDSVNDVLVGTANIELTVYGIEEVDGILDLFRFDEINASQIGYGRLEAEQIPKLNHNGRIKEKLIPKQTSLTRYDDFTFTTQTSDYSVLGDGTTFFAITDKSYSFEPIENFDNSFPGDEILFKNPSFSTYTNLNIDAASIAEVSDEASYSGTYSYKIAFRFKDNNDGRWLQLTTSGYNPTVDINKKLSIHLMVESGSFYLGLGIRKSYIANPVIGQNGGVSFSNGQDATIEFVGVDELRESSPDYLDVPTPQGKYLVNANPGVWQTFEFDIPKENVLPFTGNGTLTTANGYATLEHLNITINSDSDDPTEEILFYIDEVVQLTDALAAGTNQGIKKSLNFGSDWDLVRYTTTPVHKFYKANFNEFVWAISAKEVYYSNNVDEWFKVGGLDGIQFIRDIVDDSSGNVFVSTNRGVYVLEIETFSTFSEFFPTSQTNAFSTECYAIWNENNYVLASTELGVYRSSDLGENWELTSLSPNEEIFFSVVSTTLGDLASSKDSIFRKLSGESQFLKISDLNEQSDGDIDEIWKMSFFEGNVYLSTNDGTYQNTLQNMFDVGIPETLFEKVFISTEKNNNPFISYSLDVIGDKLFLGGENILYSSNFENSIYVRKEFVNKENPSVNIDKETRNVGFIYSSFNGAVCFRESVSPNSSVSLDLLPRKIFTTENGGWSQSNINSPILIYVNGNPKWVDFKLDETSITNFATTLNGFILNDLQPSLNDRNSHVSDELLNETLTSIDIILNGTKIYDSNGAVVNTAPLVNFKTVSDLIKNYWLLKSSVNEDLIGIKFPVPSFNINGQTVDERIQTVIESYESITLDELNYNYILSEIINFSDFKNAFYGNYLEIELLWRIKYYNIQASSQEWTEIQRILSLILRNKTITNIDVPGEIESKEGFTAENSDGIKIDPYSGTVDFSSYDLSTNPENRTKFDFSKNDNLVISIYWSQIGDAGTESHNEIEDSLELVNSGMPSFLASNVHGNLIKTGIYLEKVYPYGFDTYYVQNIKSRYYPAIRANWYDQLNSTIDYNLLIETSSALSGKIAFDMHWFNEDPYLVNKLWIATDVGIFEYDFDSTGNITFSRNILSGKETRSISTDEEFIYVIADDKIYSSLDYGDSWGLVEAFNLPEKLFSLIVSNNNLIVGTDDGIWWNGKELTDFYKSKLSYSSLLNSSEKSNADKAFAASILNVHEKNFIFAESQKSFFVSQGGSDFVALGELLLNEVSVINKIYFYKNNLWVAADKGLYTDGGTSLSEKISFNLQYILGASIDSKIPINDIVGSAEGEDTSIESMYFGGNDGKIYKLAADSWKSFQTTLSTIHKMILIEDFTSKYLVSIGYDKINITDITVFDDVSKVVSVEIEPCLET